MWNPTQKWFQLLLDAVVKSSDFYFCGSWQKHWFSSSVWSVQKQTLNKSFIDFCLSSSPNSFWLFKGTWLFTVRPCQPAVLQTTAGVHVWACTSHICISKTRMASNQSVGRQQYAEQVGGGVIISYIKPQWLDPSADQSIHRYRL